LLGDQISTDGEVDIDREPGTGAEGVPVVYAAAAEELDAAGDDGALELFCTKTEEESEEALRDQFPTDADVKLDTLSGHGDVEGV
jgi:hypothetical protein